MVQGSGIRENVVFVVHDARSFHRIWTSKNSELRATLNSDVIRVLHLKRV